MCVDHSLEETEERSKPFCQIPFIPILNVVHIKKVILIPNGPINFLMLKNKWLTGKSVSDQQIWSGNSKENSTKTVLFLLEYKRNPIISTT
jgi:hypothetical protein